MASGSQAASEGAWATVAADDLRYLDRYDRWRDDQIDEELARQRERQRRREERDRRRQARIVQRLGGGTPSV